MRLPLARQREVKALLPPPLRQGAHRAVPRAHRLLLCGERAQHAAPSASMCQTASVQRRLYGRVCEMKSNSGGATGAQGSMHSSSNQTAKTQRAERAAGWLTTAGVRYWDHIPPRPIRWCPRFARQRNASHHPPHRSGRPLADPRRPRCRWPLPASGRMVRVVTLVNRTLPLRLLAARPPLEPLSLLQALMVGLVTAYTAISYWWGSVGAQSREWLGH